MLKKIAKKLYKYRIFYCAMNLAFNAYTTRKFGNPLWKGKVKRLKNEFDVFFNKLESGENFALVRDADGELALMCHKPRVTQEQWVAPNHATKLGEAVLDSLNVDDKNFYYAISCPCCDKEGYFFYKSRIKNKNITFSNIWVNINFARFKGRFEALNRDCVLVANYRAKKLMQNGAKLGNMRILKHYEISDDCISFWENGAPQMLEAIIKDFGDAKDLLFVVSAGPMSSPLIKRLFLHNPNNTYVDFGSSIDSYYMERETRPYQDKYSIFGSRNCYLPLDLNTDISVVLTLYKREFALEAQLEAIEKQSIKPKEILLFVDSKINAESSDTKDESGESRAGKNTESSVNLSDKIPPNIANRVTNIISVRNNVGVWGRFAGGLLAKSEFVCFFDDDTIPAHRWLENCFCENLAREGLYGGVGIVANDLARYPFDKFYKVGWEHKPPFCLNNARTKKVDFIGHSWFLRKDFLGAMWINANEFYAFKNVAEDAYLSFALRKFLGINSFVPPHKDKEFFSSTKGVEYGTNEDAISQNMDNFHKMNAALVLLKKRGMREVAWSAKYFGIFIARNVLKKIYKDSASRQRIQQKIKDKFS